MGKDWSTMTRAELIAEKGRWESQLQDVNLQMKAAGRRAAATRKYLPVAQYHGLAERRVALAAGLRGIQNELTRISEGRRESSRWEDCFIDAAEELLSPQEYERVARRADELEKAHGAGR